MSDYAIQYAMSDYAIQYAMSDYANFSEFFQGVSAIVCTLK